MAKKEKRFRKPSTMQIFDLKNSEDADAYYALLEQIAARKIQVPVIAKGSSRIVDFSNKTEKLNLQSIFTDSFSRYEKQLLGPMTSKAIKGSPAI